MKVIRYKIDDYSIQIFASDKKGKRVRWGDRLIFLYSEGKCIAQATFSCEDSKCPEPFCADNIIYYFAPGYQYASVIDLIRNETPVYIAWKPISDPKEPGDGDAYFHTAPIPEHEI
jgi:hypothetical protein